MFCLCNDLKNNHTQQQYVCPVISVFTKLLLLPILASREQVFCSLNSRNSFIFQLLQRFFASKADICSESVSTSTLSAIKYHALLKKAGQTKGKCLLNRGQWYEGTVCLLIGVSSKGHVLMLYRKVKRQPVYTMEILCGSLRFSYFQKTHCSSDALLEEHHSNIKKPSLET